MVSFAAIATDRAILTAPALSVLHSREDALLAPMRGGESRHASEAKIAQPGIPPTATRGKRRMRRRASADSAEAV